MKVFILGDGAGWVVDHNIDKMVEGIPCEFTRRAYTKISSAEFLGLARQHDLVHYGNWAMHHLDVLDDVLTSVPVLLTIRSHRYPDYVKDVARRVTRVHVVSPLLLGEFPGAIYIPNGIFAQFRPESPFVVGFAGLPDDYKGFGLIKRACQELGIEFRPATGKILSEEMPRYYRSINLYVCASEAEGFSTPVMECMAMNVPVVTTNVGVPSTLNVVKVERSVEGIKHGIEKFYTAKQVLPEFSWENVNQQFYALYQELVGG